jgi:probable rRNA maturation factor
MIEVHVTRVGVGRISPQLPADEQIEGAVRLTLTERGFERAEVSVTLLDDPQIRQMNARHLNHDHTTDVISFPLWHPHDPLVVGDVYIGAEQALRQARDEGVDPLEEVLRLVVHGTLHVSGLDHPDAADDRAESPMYVLQERLVAQLLAAFAERGADGA